MDELRKSERYATKKFTDATYEGEIVEGKRQGQGLMKYFNGRFYEGGWAEDLRDGKGFELYSNGNTYEGDFRKGRADGKGIYTWNNGEVYDGEWHKGLKHGDGVWKGSLGDSYIGEWRNSKAEGYGVHIWKNGSYCASDPVGDRYEGEWKECLKHGNGTDIFANGDVYIGQYKFGTLVSHNVLGKPCGYGQYTWKNGSTYTGEFQNGLKSGFGKYRKSKESRTNVYEGQYYRDKKQGFGIFKWASGNVYRGQYKADEREGIGEMRWTDGSIYVGQWERGIQHGYGRMIFPDGMVKEGLFENNVYKGPIKQSDIPPELLVANFDIMSLAPSDVFFSEEVKNFVPAIRPSLGGTHTRFPTATGRFDDYEGRDTKYSLPPPAQSQNQPRSQTRSFSKEHRRPRRLPMPQGPARSSSTMRPDLAASSRTLVDKNPGSAQRFRKGMMMNASSTYGPAKVSPLRARQRSRPKRVWVPSGKIHYAADMPLRRTKYLS